MAKYIYHESVSRHFQQGEGPDIAFSGHYGTSRRSFGSSIIYTVTMSPPPLSIQVSNTIAACNYMARTSARPAPARTRRTWLARSSKLPRGGASAPAPPVPAPPPAIVISEDVSSSVAVAPDDEAPATKRRESLGTIALKVTRDKSLGRERRRSQGDMSHIRAKWLLGFNLTMVIILNFIVMDMHLYV